MACSSRKFPGSACRDVFLEDSLRSEVKQVLRDETILKDRLRESLLMPLKFTANTC